MELPFVIGEELAGSLILPNDEAANSQLSSISLSELSAGEYVIEVTAFSPAETVDHYTLHLSYDAVEDDLCLPIKTSDGRIAVICL